MESVGCLIAEVVQHPSEGLERDLFSGALQETLSDLAFEHGLEAPTVPMVPLPALQASHVGLFVTNAAGLSAPPYLGLALDGELCGPSVERLLGLYARAGIKVQGGWPDLPDHLAVAGEALSVLAGPDPEATRQLAFEFMLPWFECFVPMVELHDPTGFYAINLRFVLDVLKEVRRESLEAALSEALRRDHRGAGRARLASGTGAGAEERALVQHPD